MAENPFHNEAQGMVPPSDLEAEQSVLGAILVRPQVFDDVADLIGTEDFYRTAHGTIFRAMVDLWIKKEPIDLVTVTGLLRTRGKLEEVGGPVFLAGLSEHVGFSVNAPYYAKKVKDLSRLRTFLATCQELTTKSMERVEDVDSFIDDSEAKLFRLIEKPRNGTRGLGELLQEEIIKVEELHELKREGGLIGLTSGFIDLDATTGGFQAGDLILLAARPSMGKTAMAMNFVLNAKAPAAVFSLEMSCSQIAQRVIATQGSIDGTRLRTGKLTPDEWVKLQDLAPDSDLPIFINDTASLTPMELRAQARRLAMRHEIKMVVVDYLQLMSAKAKSREQEVSEISRSLKALAKELRVPVIALSQLNRDVEKRTNRRPILSDLRDSGSLEQDADLIIFLYREKVYNDECKHNITEVHVAKQRNGPTRRVKLTFFPEYYRFADFSPEEP